jgi:predicted ATPase
MGGVKLLAIRTGRHLSKELPNEYLIDFFKVLDSNTFYKFYSEYSYLNENEFDIEKGIDNVAYIKHSSEVPEKLYNQKDLNINISALVGKNGSGKSTLLELYYISIYLFSVSKELLEFNFSSIKEKEKELIKEEKDLTKRLNTDLRKVSTYSEIEVLLTEIEEKLDLFDDKNLKFHPLHENLRYHLNEYNRFKEQDKTYFTKKTEEYIDWSKNINKIIKSLDLEIFYQLGSSFYALKIGAHKNLDQFVSLKIIPKLSNKNTQKAVGFIDKIDLSKHFFYTIAVSYSHYGLNALEEGEWLNELFHKNDSYQTPIVINPMRTKGVIEINKEKKLVNQRLLSNLLEPVNKKDLTTLRHLTPEKKAVKLLLNLNHYKFERYKGNHELNHVTNIESVSELLYEKYTGSKFKKPKRKVFIVAYYYIQNKLIRICGLYDRYKPFLKGNKINNIDRLVDELVRDRSHITFKIKQTINFIKFDHIKWYPDLEFSVTVFPENINDLSERIKTLIKQERKEGRKRSTIEFLPPSIFDIKIELENGSLFERMSSGEKQKVYSISSIVYHLININSVFNNNQDKSEKKLLEYKYVNILLDEVEQYYHPEMQRTFINDLITYIGKINRNNIKNIKGINILFATHSPFILSDIPHQNVLSLPNIGNEIDVVQTFGANIHEMLLGEFFMKSTTGEYVRTQINELLNLYNLIRLENVKATLNSLKSIYI